MAEEFTDLGTLVQDIVGQVERGLEGTEYHVKDSGIEIELVVTKTKNVGGRLQLILAQAGGKYEKEELSKIKFSLSKEGNIKILD